MAIHENIETILLKRNKEAWRKNFGPKKFDRMLSESETEDKQRAFRSGSYKPGDEAPKVSTQNSTVTQQKPDNSFYTDEVNSGTMRKSGHATNAGSDPYAIQEPRQKPYTNPYDIPQGYNPNDYVYKNVAPKVNADPYAKTWTPEQQTRKQLQDATIERDNLLNSFVGMPTTEVVVKLGEHDDTIKRLSQELGVTDSASVPTMTAPIPEYSQPEEPAWSAPKPEPADDEQPEFELYEPVEPQLTLAEQIQQNALDKLFGQYGGITPDWEKPQDGSDNAGGGYVNLYDDIPTMEDIEAAKAEQAEERTEQHSVGSSQNDTESNGTDSSVIDKGHYYVENIFQYQLDKANTNMSSDEFDKKYPYGEQLLEFWQDELADIIGEEECNNYVDTVSQIGASDIESSTEGNNEEETILDTLESLAAFAKNNKLTDINYCVLQTIENINQNGGFSDTAVWYQKDPDITGNPIYVEEVDGGYIEMETLNEWRLPEFGGRGTQTQEAFEKLKTLFWPPGVGLVNTVIGAIVGDIEDQYNLGQVLQAGDVRITVQTQEWTDTEYKASYFYRDSKLLYAVAENGTIIWGDVVEPPF